jgi:hypothetical protein
LWYGSDVSIPDPDTDPAKLMKKLHAGTMNVISDAAHITMLRGKNGLNCTVFNFGKIGSVSGPKSKILKQYLDFDGFDMTKVAYTQSSS